MERYAESGHEVVERASPVCNMDLCGIEPVKDCVAERESLAGDSGGEGSPICAANSDPDSGKNRQVDSSSTNTGTN